MEREARRHAGDVDIGEGSTDAARGGNDVERVAQGRHEGAVDIDVKATTELSHVCYGKSVELVEERAGKFKLDEAGTRLLVVLDRLVADRVETGGRSVPSTSRSVLMFAPESVMRWLPTGTMIAPAPLKVAPAWISPLFVTSLKLLPSETVLVEWMVGSGLPAR